VLQVPEYERKVKEATSNEKWGPTATQMKEISSATFNTYNDLPIIMDAIWKRLGDHGKNWRHVYKTLLLIDHIIRNGHEQATAELRSGIMAIKTLAEFQHIDEEGKDCGISVRERARLVCEVLMDDNKLQSEREKARATAKKFENGGSMANNEIRSDDNDGFRINSDKFNKPKEDKPSSSSSSSSTTETRPRAPSFGETKKTTTATTTTPPKQSAPVKNLLDFDDTPAPKPKPTSDLFSDFTGSSHSNTNSNTGFGNFTSSTPSNNGFGATNTGFGSTTSANNGFGFTSTPSNNGFGATNTGFGSTTPANNGFGFTSTPVNNGFGATNTGFSSTTPANNGFGFTSTPVNNNGFGFTSTPVNNGFGATTDTGFGSFESAKKPEPKVDPKDPWSAVKLDFSKKN